MSDKITRERILELLSAIPDPETQQDLVSANLIGDLHIEDRKINLQINSLNPALHARKRMEEAVRFRLEKELGSNVELSIKVTAVSGVERKGRRSVLPEVKNVVAIASGKGGVGKSTLTANLAAGLAQAQRVHHMRADGRGGDAHAYFRNAELRRWAGEEGRSLSNLCLKLIEASLQRRDR